MRILRNRWVMLFLMLGWMGIIFRFSAQPAAESTEVSGSVAYRIVSASERLFRMDLSETERQNYAEMLDHPVRKIAHMTEYAILSLFCYGFYFSLRQTGGRCSLLAAVTAIGYAATDEFHQLFVPGRAGRISDVCIDSVGVVLMLLMLSLIGKIWRKHCEKQTLPVQ